MKIYIQLLTISLLLAMALSSFSQVIIADDGSTTADSDAILELKSDSKGLLVPRLTTVQRLAIVTPVDGLLVWDLTKGQFYVSDGGEWESSSSSWFGSPTRIKLLPKDFIATYYGGNQGTQTAESIYSDNNDGNGFGLVTTDNGGYLVAFVSVPTGYKATTVTVYGSNSTANYSIYLGNIATADDLTTALGSSTIGSQIDFADVISTTTNYLIIVVEFPAKDVDQLWGGYIDIEGV